MKPLLAIGVGMLWIVLTTKGTSVDWFPAPIGWAIILLALPGLRREPAVRPQWGGLLAIAVIALLASVLVWLPAGAELLAEDEALGWAADLPKFAFFALLCQALIGAASDSDDPQAGSASGWLRINQVGLVAVAVAPVLVFGAGWEWLGGHAAFAAQVVLLMTMVLCFSYSSRTWAGVADETKP